jgi:hypothetical protein
MEALVLSLLTWIGTAGGYPVPAEPPGVEFVAPRFIWDTMCEGRPCGVGAMYRRGGRVVYVDERLRPARNLFDSAVLLHELVHYVQDASGRFPGRDCRTWVAQEREAYTLQAAWLREHRRRYPLRAQLPDESQCEAADAGR